MPGTATQLYPTAGPRVNGYRSVRTGSGLVGASRRAVRERLAWNARTRVHCSLARFLQCLASRSFRELFCGTLAGEVAGHPSVGSWGTGFERGAVLMRVCGRAIAGAAGLEGTDRWPAVARVAGADSHLRGKA